MQNTYTIAAAIPMLEEFLVVLDQAFWEANTLTGKDTLYDSISAINKELSELAKLSIQDHDLVYEPICPEFKVAKSRLPYFRKSMDECISRSMTIVKLEAAISGILNLTKDHSNTAK